MERYHATSVLSLTARVGQQSGARHTTPAWFQEIYFSAAPFHFLLDLRDDVDARGFL